MKLLNYTSIRYLLFAALLLLISVPAFYLVLDKIFIHTIDKDLYENANEIPAQINSIKSDKDLALWKTLDNDLEILDTSGVAFHPKPFTQKKQDKDKDEIEDFRILQKKTNILGKEYIIQIESSLVEKDDLVKTILVIQLCIFFSLLAGAAVINYFINKKVWKPFYDSLYFLQQFNLENTIAETPKPLKIQEFNRLNTSIHRLSVSVRKSYLLQKEFIENASHELQTPLAILKFKLELLLQEQNLSGSQSQLINDMYKEIEQMQELNNNLLLLSKIGNGQFVANENILLADAVKDVVNNLSLLADSKSQKVVENYENEHVQLHANKTLLKVLIKNLLLNALQYSEEKATVRILINENYLSVSNPGIPLNISNDKVFSRFNKNGSQKGNGLGLSIVKAIADLFHYEIAYEYGNGQHHFILHYNA